MKLLKIAWLTLCVAIVGCGAAGQQSNPEETSGPLTVEKWKQLPLTIKYDERSFERLRENDPQLDDEAAWDRFMRDVVIPDRKKDIPGTPGG